MYEQIKKYFQEEKNRSIKILRIIAIVIIVLSFMFLGLIGIIFGIYLLYKSITFASIKDGRFQHIENYLGLTPSQIEQLLEKSDRIDEFTFINDAFFIDFKNDFVFSFDKLVDYKISDVYTVNGFKQFDITIGLKNKAQSSLKYPADMHDKMAELFRRNVKDNSLPLNRNPEKHIDLAKHTAPAEMQVSSSKGIDLVKHNVPSAMQTNQDYYAGYEGYTAAPVKKYHTVSKKKESYSLRSISSNPDLSDKPLPKFKKIIIENPNVETMKVVILTLVGILGWVCAGIISNFEFWVNVFFGLWTFGLILSFITKLSAAKKELYFDLNPLGVKNSEQLYEMLSSSIRLSEYGFLTEKYLFMADTIKLIKLSDITGAVESEYSKKNRPVFAINVFTDKNSVMIPFRNEKERDYTLDAIKIIIAQNELAAYDEPSL